MSSKKSKIKVSCLTGSLYSKYNPRHAIFLYKNRPTFKLYYKRICLQTRDSLGNIITECCFSLTGGHMFYSLWLWISLCFIFSLASDMNPADVCEALTFATCWTALKVNRAQVQKSIYDGSQGSEVRASQVHGAHVDHFSWLLSPDIGFFLYRKGWFWICGFS